MQYIALITLDQWPQYLPSDRLQSFHAAETWITAKMSVDVRAFYIYQLCGYTITDTWVLDNGAWRKL